MPLLPPKDPPGRSETISSESDQKDGLWLQSAAFIKLASAPLSGNAKALTAQVGSLMLPHLDQTRPIGLKGMLKFTADTGTILAGILRGSFKGSPVSAQRRRSGSQWDYALIGRVAFWTKVDAMSRAGLIGQEMGVQMAEARFDELTFGGLPSRMWATQLLLDLASGCGVGADTHDTDWCVSPLAESRRFDVPALSLIIMKETRETGRVNATPANVLKGQAGLLHQVRQDVAELNACVALADIRGCRFPVFRRNFLGGDLRLHGRHYAIGSDSFQSMSEAARSTITIDGQPVVELDIRASFLCVFLALTGTKSLPDGDPYLIGGLPRSAVKQWIAQSFGSGKPVTRWSERTTSQARAEKPKVVMEAVVAAYPAFGRPLTDILPGDLKECLEEKQHGWAVGQYLTFRESTVISGVMQHLVSRGHPVLPMHDGLIVPAGVAMMAKGDMERAFKALLGVVPVVR